MKRRTQLRCWMSMHWTSFGDSSFAAEQLAEVGLLKEDKSSKKKGRFVQFYKKVGWDHLTDDAKSEAERLQIPRSSFE